MRVGHQRAAQSAPRPAARGRALSVSREARKGTWGREACIYEPAMSGMRSGIRRIRGEQAPNLGGFILFLLFLRLVAAFRRPTGVSQLVV